MNPTAYSLNCEDMHYKRIILWPICVPKEQNNITCLCCCRSVSDATNLPSSGGRGENNGLGNEKDNLPSGCGEDKVNRSKRKEPSRECSPLAKKTKNSSTKTNRLVWYAVRMSKSSPVIDKG